MSAIVIMLIILSICGALEGCALLHFIALIRGRQERLDGRIDAVWEDNRKARDALCDQLAAYRVIDTRADQLMGHPCYQIPLRVDLGELDERLDVLAKHSGVKFKYEDAMWKVVKEQPK